MPTRSNAASLAAIAAATAALAAVPAGQAQLPSCPPGTTNSLYCQTTGVQSPQATTIRGTALSANVCRARTRPLRVSETITSASGIRSITVTLDGRRVKAQISSHAALATRHLSLTIGTRGLRTGIHTIRIKVVDSAGRTTTRTLHFRICAASRIPKFTG